MSRPWMPLYVADYLADTGHLSTLEHGAYMLLIMHYWSKGSLPDDDKRLASIARALPEQWADMRSTIAEFFDDGWKHSRIDAELVNAAKAYERRAAAGRAGGKAKAEGKQCSSNATAGLKQSYSQPQTVKEEPNGSSKKRAARLPNDFEPDYADSSALGLSPMEHSEEAAKFRDYWIAQPGQRGVKTDWPATWRNWCRKAVQDRRGRPRAASPPNRKPNAFDAYDEIAQMKGWNDEPASLSGANQDAERLPAVNSGPAGPLVDLRRGHDWHPGSGDN